MGLLKLLIHGIGFAIPCHIADVGEQGGAFRRCDEFVAEAVFIADIEGDFLIFHHQRRLVVAAFLKVGQRHIHHFIEALGNGGQGLVFAKWNEVVLGVVGDDIGSAVVIVAQIDDCIFVAVAVGRILADADGQCTAVALCLFGELFQDAFGQVLAHQRQGGFRQDDDVGTGLADLFVVFLNGRNDLLFLPFQILLDVALNQGNRAGAAVGAGVFGLLGNVADGAERNDKE